MSFDKSTELRTLLMKDGTVYAQLDASSPDRVLELHTGDAIVPFTTCRRPPDADGKTENTWFMQADGIALRSHSDPYEEKPGDIYACWVNRLEDWALPGTQTVQVLVSRYLEPCKIYLGVQLDAPAPAAGKVLHLGMAIHRGKADLICTFTDPSSGKTECKSIAFDPNCRGGQRRDGFQWINLPLPNGFSDCEIAFQVDYHGYVPAQDAEEPYVFIADAKVVSQSAPTDNQGLTSPANLLGEPEENGKWFEAELPDATAAERQWGFADGTSLHPFLYQENPHITVRENYGHTLILESDRAGPIVLRIDGQFAERINARVGDNILRLPARFLNGHVHHLSLFDASGSIRLFEAQQLVPNIVTTDDVMRRESCAPFPTALFAQTPLRYAALKAALQNAGNDTDFAQLSHALATVEGGHENVTLRPLAFPVHDAPDISIVIPAHNNVHVTYLALCSLLLCHNDTSFEVIVVDDGSSDETTTLERFVSGITVLHNSAPQRFIKACNAGAARARGHFIVLLNNDVEVTAGWLDALVDGFDRFDNVGLVGAKLLYPNGDLQDAGGIVWNNGNPWNYGKGKNASDPRYCYARQVDYLSGAALMIRRSLWREIGGLSAEMEPMYFEDTDLAFQVRAKGYTTWYIPSAIVYHYEGLTSGTDITVGPKKFQEVNRPKFKRRWAADFAGLGTEGTAPDLAKDRNIVGRVLFIDYAPPRPDRDAGSYAAVQEMRLVQSLGFKVTFLSTNMAHLGSYTDALQRDGIEVIHAPFFMSAGDYIEAHGKDFDAVYITRYYVAQAVLDLIRSAAPQAKVLFNNADLHFLRELRAAQAVQDPDRLDQARKTRESELDVIGKVDVVLSYNQIEHSVMQAYSDGAATVVTCPWVTQARANAPGLEGRFGMSFLGSFKHHPNAEGIEWFARTIMPSLADLEIPLSIYGAGMTEQIKSLRSDLVHPVGYVETVTDAFDPHRIFVAPLLSGAGIKGKVISALSNGIPCVLSPIAAEGIGLRSGHDCLIADTPEEWRHAIARLQAEGDLWQTLSKNALNYMQDAFSFDIGRERMRAAFEAADIFASRR